MSTELRQLRARLSVQEKTSLTLSVRLEEMAEQLEGLASKEDIQTLSAKMDQQQASVDERFKHVYGELADIKANVVEVRDLLATLVARFEKQ